MSQRSYKQIRPLGPSRPSPPPPPPPPPKHLASHRAPEHPHTSPSLSPTRRCSNPPRVLTGTFSYPDPLSGCPDNPLTRRVSEIRRLEALTVALEAQRWRNVAQSDTSGPRIRPSSAHGQRRPHIRPPVPHSDPQTKSAVRPKSAGSHVGSDSAKRDTSPLKKSQLRKNSCF